MKVVIEIDFTLWGGFKPRLKKEWRSILSVFRKFVITQSLLTLQTEANSSQNCIQSAKSNNWILEIKVAHANLWGQLYLFWNLYLFPQTCSSFPLHLSILGPSIIIFLPSQCSFTWPHSNWSRFLPARFPSSDFFPLALTSQNLFLAYFLPLCPQVCHLPSEHHK